MTDNRFLVLGKLLRSNDPFGKDLARLVMAEMNDDVLPALAESMFSHDDEIREAAFLVLLEMGTKAGSVVPLLVPALKDSDANVRMATTALMMHIGEGAVVAIPALIETLGDSDELVRMNAKNALSTMRKHAIPALIQAIKGDNDLIRQEAMDVLCSSPGNKGALAALVQVLNDESDVNRWKVVEAVTRFRGLAIPALKEALSDVDPRVCREATLGLGRIGKMCGKQTLWN